MIAIPVMYFVKKAAYFPPISCKIDRTQTPAYNEVEIMLPKKNQLNRTHNHKENEK